eukprot:156026_1
MKTTINIGSQDTVNEPEQDVENIDIGISSNEAGKDGTHSDGVHRWISGNGNTSLFNLAVIGITVLVILVCILCGWCFFVKNKTKRACVIIEDIDVNIEEEQDSEGEVENSEANSTEFTVMIKKEGLR